MHARVATFEGGDPEKIRQAAEEMRTREGEGPPEGVPAVGYLMLHQADEGKVVAITLFETEEDMETGDATLSSMTPSVDMGGGRSSVEKYEVGAKLEA